MLDLAMLRDKLGEILPEAARIAIAEREKMLAQLKSDGSIVTNADFAVDGFLKRVLGELLPTADYWGEEEGYHPGGIKKDQLWLVDPVDGTSNFRYGLPLWGISVGLMSEGKLVLGGILLPDLGELYLAASGLGATFNGSELPKIKQGPIHPSELISVSENLLKNHPRGNWPGKMRLSGAFVVDGTFVAKGRFRGLIGRREKLYDVAACVVICRELGAVVSLADGSEWNEAEYGYGTYLEEPWVIFPAGSGWTLQEGVEPA